MQTQTTHSHAPQASKLRYTWVKPDLGDAVSVVSEALCRAPDPELQRDVQEHLDSAEFAMSVYDQGKLIGFMIFSVPIKGVLYIAGTMFRAKYQGLSIKALGTRLTAQVFSGIKFVSGRTQSPIVWSSVAKIASNMLPHPTTQDPELEQLQTQLATELGMSAPLEPGFYGGPLYGKKPLHRDLSIQAWWDGFIDFERGDAVLYIARLT